MACPLRPYDPHFATAWWDYMTTPSICRQLIPTCLSLVRWDLRDPENYVAGGYHRVGADTQAMTIELDPSNGIANNPYMRRLLRRQADIFAAYLRDRLERFGCKPVPLTREGAQIIIDRLKKTQSRAKIKRLEKVADLINWNEVALWGLNKCPKSRANIFIKAEGYPAGTKPPRLIVNPQDGEKLLMSMALYHIMHPLFSSPYCTKEISEHDRPLVIERRLGEGHKFVADYTSFECLPNKTIMQCGEHRVLRQLVPPEYHFIFPWVEKGGLLTSKSGVRLKTTAVQFSGRYNTSLCNTIRNKLLMDTVAAYLGANYRGVFEGDDSLTCWYSPVTKEDIQNALGKLGAMADIDEVENFGSAGYCSMYWNQDYELVCEPLKVLATFPFSQSSLSSRISNHNMLLASKAMSLAYRSPGCPIISALVKKYIAAQGYMETRNEYERRWFREFSRVESSPRGKKRRSKSVEIVTFDRWDLVRDPTPTQRDMFTELFSIDYASQIAAEDEIMRTDGFSELLFEYLRPAQGKAGLHIDEAKQIYQDMRSRAMQYGF